MKKEFYEKIYTFMKKHGGLSRAAVVLSKSITFTIYLFYPVFICLLYLQHSSFLLSAFLVPAVSFIILSVVRRIINAERPYEKFNIPTLYGKCKKGCSFPSRHTFSAFMIAFTLLFVNIPIGITLLVLSTILALLRILCGAHFIKDVLTGAVFAAISALIGFIII